MHHLGVLLGGLPVVTLGAAWYALRPVEPVVGAARLAAVRAAVLVGAGATVGVEVLSAIGLLTRVGDAILWLVALVGAATGAVVRHRRQAPGPAEPRKWLRLGPLEWLIVAGLAFIGIGTLVVALAAEPNTWDSQAYHLPKVEQWVANGSVRLFPSPFYSQPALAPGAEYLLLHLRLLTGGDALANMVQWGAGVLCVLAASRVAAQLGAGRLGQLVTAFVVASAPMVVVQASSTQTDLTVAAWCACVATLALGAVSGSVTVFEVLLLGAAAGLALNTKATGVVAVGPMLVLWFVARAWRSRSKRGAATMVGAAFAVAAIALVIMGPFLARMTVTYGNPMGPPIIQEHSTERHDIPAVVVNAAKMFQTVTLVPDDHVNTMTAHAVERLARALGQNVNDPKMTLVTPYPLSFYSGPDEDFGSFPVQVLAACAGLLFCVFWRRRDPWLLGYAAACLAMGIGYAATVKWQAFGNRFLLAGLIVAAPLAGLAADGLMRRVRLASRALVAAGLSLVLVLAGWSGADAVLNGRPRALYGPDSVLTADPLSNRFRRAPMYRADYEWAAGLIRGAGARRVGMVEGPYWFEYPWWILLRGRHLVHLKSDVPGHPGPSPTSVDAIICFVPAPASCMSYVPPGWTVQARTYVTVALRPTR